MEIDKTQGRIEEKQFSKVCRVLKRLQKLSDDAKHKFKYEEWDIF